MTDDPALEELERRIGYRFDDRRLLIRALTHRSYANERGHGDSDNEVLEFLGDAVLGLIVSDLLCTRHPYFNEGEMSKLKSFLVSADTLGRLADELGLGAFILLGRGEEKTRGRAKNSILANAFEALIAAVYSDGGLPPAREFVLASVDPLIEEVDDRNPQPVRDFKSALQEAVQAAGLPLPTYRVIQEHGPDHDKVFHMLVDVAGRWQAQGDGRTKKRAEQDAARQVLEAVSKAQLISQAQPVADSDSDPDPDPDPDPSAG